MLPLFNIMKVLTAVAPIATTIATAVANDKSDEPRVVTVQQRQEPQVIHVKEPIQQPTNNISITIHNNFYTNSGRENSLEYTVQKSIDINKEQISSAMISSGSHYNL